MNLGPEAAGLDGVFLWREVSMEGWNGDAVVAIGVRRTFSWVALAMADRAAFFAPAVAIMKGVWVV